MRRVPSQKITQLMAFVIVIMRNGTNGFVIKELGKKYRLRTFERSHKPDSSLQSLDCIRRLPVTEV